MPDSDDRAAAWRAQRAHAVAAHAAEQARRRAADTERARALVARFIDDARARGVPTVPLRAQAYNGRTTYRTRLRGWYLRADRSLAIGEDGNFYLLTVPAGVRARLAGAVVPPHEPPLIVGEGGRDGERIPLERLLRLRLDAGDASPD